MAQLLFNKLNPSLLLRIGLAFSFLYPAFSSLTEPSNWIGFFPMSLRAVIPAPALLYLFAGYEIMLGLWLLSGRRLGMSSLFAFATLAGVVVLNLGALDLVFRDVGLAFSAAALALGTSRKR